MSKRRFQSLEWPKAFFSAPNQLEWHDVLAPGAVASLAADAQAWLQSLEREDAEGVLVLPYRDETGIQWFACAWSERAFLRLGEELGAFLGVSYGSLTKVTGTSSGHPAARAMMNGSAIGVYQYRPADEGVTPIVRKLVASYRELLERRPPTRSLVRPSVGMIRANFDKALLAGNAALAIRLRDELLDIGRLDAENREYLNIRLYAGLGDWNKIAGNYSLLHNVQGLNLPAQVITDICESIYRVHIEAGEKLGELTDAFDVFRKVISRFALLFKTRKDIRRTPVIKVFLCYELSKASPDDKSVHLMLSDLEAESSKGIDAWRNLAASVAQPSQVNQTTPLPTPLPPAVTMECPEHSLLREAKEAAESYDHDRAFRLFYDLPPSRDKILGLMGCTKELAEPERTEIFLAFVDQLPEEDLQWMNSAQLKVLNQLRQTLDTVPEEPSGGSIDNWQSWANSVIAGTDFDLALSWVQQNCLKWPVSLNEAVLLAERLQCSAPGPQAVFREAFPNVFEAFFVYPDRIYRGMKPLLETLLYLIACESGHSAEELELVRQLATELLNPGLNESEYREVITTLEDLLDQHLSFSSLGWALDIAELLATAPQADPNAALRFFVKVTELAVRNQHRVGSWERTSFELLFKDFGTEPVAALAIQSESQDQPSSVVWDEQHVAIYTLTEAAGQRAREALVESCPGLRVSLNSDLVCTDKLKALAKNADIFVFAWRSSKHMAFNCIKDNRASDLPLLQPLGKGSASILRAIFDHAK